jgi:peptide/nickel transport system substrate-binding protein
MEKKMRFSTIVMVAFMMAVVQFLWAGDGLAKLKKVPRNRTFISVGGGGEALQQFTDHESMNPYFLGHISAHGAQVIYEPLVFYNYLQDKEIPWLAESYHYNADFTELTINIRPNVTWSDGKPFTARDVVYTLNMLRDNAPELRYSTEIKKWAKNAEVVDELTAKVYLNLPNPRFLFNYLTNHQDIGIWILPEHIWKDKDPKTFSNYDVKKGWPVVTGPYELALSSKDQTIFDLRKEWWAAKTGFQPMPKVERLIFLPAFDETKHAQMMINNEVDVSLCLSPEVIKKVLKQNLKVSTFSHKNPPYGYLDWWPTSMGFNNSEPPFDDREVRWAISYAINRDEVITYGQQGLGSATRVTFPEFPSLVRYMDSISDLFQKYDTNAYDPKKTEEIMQKKGFTKGSKGFWQGPDGEPLKIVITTFPVLQSVCPPVVENLRKAGFDASYHMPADFYSRISQGIAKTFIFGHAASVRDPYRTLDLYHGRFYAPTGKATFPFYRWSNPAYDKIVDEMNLIAHDDPKMFVLYRQAMEIWLKELPDIPLVSFYHRNPINYTYWEGWPTVDDPYINDANWHKTVLLILVRLQPTQ